jgi:hypothetical protein
VFGGFVFFSGLSSGAMIFRLRFVLDIWFSVKDTLFRLLELSVSSERLWKITRSDDLWLNGFGILSEIGELYLRQGEAFCEPVTHKKPEGGRGLCSPSEFSFCLS